MQQQQPVFTPVDLLRQAPRRVIGSIAAGVGFAVIGVFNTFQFFVNRTADLIAYATNTRREEEWAPVMVATFAVIYLTYYALLRLFAEQQPEQKKINNNTSESKPFITGSDFAAALRRAGQAGTLFGSTATAPAANQRALTPPPPPASHSLTQPPTLVKRSASEEQLEKILEEACCETNQPKKEIKPS